MGCIDAPETGQRPWGQQSAAKLKQLLPPGKAVLVREIERDRYGRTVAELFLGNQSVNLRMVQEGQAVVYRHYLSGCAATQNQYLRAEAQAKQKKLGFWNQSKAVMPWDFRRGQQRNN
nr:MULTISPECIES: thermonuclease family protein [unclassified Trichocoleus]